MADNRPGLKSGNPPAAQPEGEYAVARATRGGRRTEETARNTFDPAAASGAGHRHLPYMTLPLFVGRGGRSPRWRRRCRGPSHLPCDAEGPIGRGAEGGDLYRTGTVAMIMRMLKLPDGRLKISSGVVKEDRRVLRVRPRSGPHRPDRRASRQMGRRVEALMRASREDRRSSP